MTSCDKHHEPPAPAMSASMRRSDVHLSETGPLLSGALQIVLVWSHATG